MLLIIFFLININGIRLSRAITAVTWKGIGTGMKPACPFNHSLYSFSSGCSTPRASDSTSRPEAFPARNSR